MRSLLMKEFLVICRYNLLQYMSGLIKYLIAIENTHVHGGGVFQQPLIVINIAKAMLVVTSF